jgi:hypothetical protein
MKKTFFFLALVCIWACRHTVTPPVSDSESLQPIADNDTVTIGEIRQPCNAVYYWKTVFTLNDAEKQWLADYNIGRLYIRYFDIGFDAGDDPVPIGTIRFTDPIPEGPEIVPTVFIDNDVFKRCDMMPYALRTVTRILTMSATNDVDNIREIQLDCDWTRTTETAWFAFAEAVRDELNKYGIILSSTIRLHQLNMPPPPVDRGVLMCYNTGAIRNNATYNSILSASDVALYAKHLQTYDLPLDIAYPTFSWAVLFNGKGVFQTLLREANPEDTHLAHKASNKYVVQKGFYQEGKYLIAGDELRFEFADFSEIMKSKRLLEHRLNNYSIILYHLDNKNLSKYTTDEINQIYAIP